MNGTFKIKCSLLKKELEKCIQIFLIISPDFTLLRIA